MNILRLVQLSWVSFVKKLLFIFFLFYVTFFFLFLVFSFFFLVYFFYFFFKTLTNVSFLVFCRFLPLFSLDSSGEFQRETICRFWLLLAWAFFSFNLVNDIINNKFKKFYIYKINNK